MPCPEEFQVALVIVAADTPLTIEAILAPLPSFVTAGHQLYLGYSAGVTASVETVAYSV